MLASNGSGGAEQSSESERTGTSEFAALLQRLRQAQHLSQTQLAHKLGRSPSLISLIENGRRFPTRSLIDDLVRDLNLSELDRAQLLRSAGFTSDELLSALQHVVAILAKQVNLDETGQAIVRADLTAVVTSWRTLFDGIKYLHAGRFADAHDLFRQMLKHPEYSRTLRVALYTRLADTKVELGSLAEAERWLRRASKVLACLPATWAPTLRAEYVATQAMVNLRGGLYTAARRLIETSRGIYEGLLQAVTGQDSATTMQMAYQGLGKSYKRLAQVALFQDAAAEALSYCAKAQDCFREVTSSSARDRWQRRTLELEAWAQSQLHEFDKAIELHERARAQSLAAGDFYGEAKGILYIGDDVRKQLQWRVDQALQQVGEGPLSPQERRDLVRRALGPNAKRQLARAEEMYGEALERGKGRNQRILLGRALLGLGVTLRLKATLEKKQHYYHDAALYLRQALKVEREIGQKRRLPSIYVALAELAWEEEDFKWLERARGYYQDARLALNALDAEDNASERLDRQITRALELLPQADEPHEAPVDPLADWKHLIAEGAPEAWRDLCVRLVAILHSAVRASYMKPCAASPDALAWHYELWMLEALDGRRRVAQNELSSSLGTRMPVGTPRDVKHAAFQRHDTLVRNVQANVQGDLLRARGALSPSRDLCSRTAVERELALPQKRERAIEEVSEAARLVEQSPQTYELVAGMYDLPVAFIMKDARLLVEVPPLLAPYFLHSEREDQQAMVEQVGHKATQVDPQIDRQIDAHGEPTTHWQTACYRIDNSHVAEQVAEIFDALVARARETEPPGENTFQWLRRLTGAQQRQPTLAGSAI
jgi:transcriptional regulator with XRE-family HTH domain